MARTTGRPPRSFHAAMADRTPKPLLASYLPLPSDLRVGGGGRDEGKGELVSAWLEECDAEENCPHCRRDKAALSQNEKKKRATPIDYRIQHPSRGKRKTWHRGRAFTRGHSFTCNHILYCSLAIETLVCLLYSEMRFNNGICLVFVCISLHHERAAASAILRDEIQEWSMPTIRMYICSAP